MLASHSRREREPGSIDHVHISVGGACMRSKSYCGMGVPSSSIRTYARRFLFCKPERNKSVYVCVREGIESSMAYDWIP